MLKMDSLRTDDQLTIVNRSKEHRVSKKLIRKIPYFDMMLDYFDLESEVHKVELDFDEQTFKIILDWIEMDFMYIEMDYVINLCTMADYFKMNDDLIKDCFTYFHKKFSLEYLSTIISQVTSTSKLVNSSVLDAFICRHFLKIARTNCWLSYQFETVYYICKLELMINSEYQVFEAIMEWINFLSDFRKSHLELFLNAVRWCRMESKHLTKIKENEHIKSINFKPIFCSPESVGCVCTRNRTKQEYFIAIEKSEGTDLRIKVLDGDFLPLINQVIQLDDSMPLHVLHDEHVSDISFDSGRQMIRVDWKQSKYRLLDYETYESHCFEIAKCTHKIYNKSKYQGTKNHSSFQNIYANSLLEANGKFILLRICYGSVDCWSNPRIENSKPKLFGYENNFIATILDKNIYILTENFDCMTFKMDQEGEIKMLRLKKLQEQLKFEDLILTSSQVKGKVFLVDKATKSVFSLNYSKEWNLMGLLVNYKSSKTDGQKEPKLLTFTSTFLSIDAIRPCLKRKLDFID